MRSSFAKTFVLDVTFIVFMRKDALYTRHADPIHFQGIVMYNLGILLIFRANIIKNSGILLILYIIMV